MNAKHIHYSNIFGNFIWMIKFLGNFLKDKMFGYLFLPLKHIFGILMIPNKKTW